MCVCGGGRGKGGRPGKQSGSQTGKAGRGQVRKHLIGHVKVWKPESGIVRGFFCQQPTLLQLHLAISFTFPNHKSL